MGKQRKGEPGVRSVHRPLGLALPLPGTSLCCWNSHFFTCPVCVSGARQFSLSQALSTDGAPGLSRALSRALGTQ